MSGKITALIVDDEPHAREGLKNALEKFEQLDVVALCENGLEAVKAVNELKPRIMFLDIQMPKLDGFDVLELLGKDAPLVIFVTAFDEYAVNAFEANAVDYLLKPLDPTRLETAVQRALERLDSGQVAQLTALIDDPPREDEIQRRILVRDGSEVHVLAADDVMYIESADDYVAIHTADATHIKLDRLSKLEKQLDPRQFCRIHRSCLLNINFLARIEQETKDTHTAILTNDKQLPISRSGYGNLKQLL